jgi:type II restriction endonuclease EcoO109I-like protein
VNEDQLLEEIKVYISEVIFNKHKKNVLSKHSKLSSYNINPIIVKYLSKVLEGNFTPEGIAKALYYPRVLGTSINTSFGTSIQKMFVDLGIANGSLIKGIDIEFIDTVDNRLKYCQLKSGPNTINYEDVKPLISKFSTVLGLARTNSSKTLNNNDLIVGVLYGEPAELSRHYQKIDEIHPVIVGENFWRRITGFDGFYSRLKVELDELILGWESEDFFIEGLNLLINDVSKSDLFK